MLKAKAKKKVSSPPSRLLLTGPLNLNLCASSESPLRHLTLILKMSRSCICDNNWGFYCQLSKVESEMLIVQILITEKEQIQKHKVSNIRNINIFVKRQYLYNCRLHGKPEEIVIVMHYKGEVATASR